MRYMIKGKEIYAHDRVLKDAALVVNGDLIEAVGVSGEESRSKVKGMKVIDMSRYKIIPGLIDLHIHGANGYDVMDATYEALAEISIYLAANGVTSFLATAMTERWNRIKNAVQNIDAAMNKGVGGAKIMGAYLEGPFIGERYKGAQPAAFIREINAKDMEELFVISPANIKVVTVDPEKQGALELIKLLAAKKIKISLGHTGATYEQTKEAISGGANIAVHTFNGMRGLHHREPGVVGAILESEDIFAELIADTVHVHPAVMGLLVKCKGREKVCLISDCMKAGGLKDGEYQLGDLKVIVKDAVARIESGSLAGSTLRLIDGVRNMAEKTEVSLADAVHMASLSPAEALGKGAVIGSIRSGKRADMTVIDDRFRVLMTIINGKVVYERKTGAIKKSGSN